MKKLIGIVLLLGIAVIATLTNPSKEDYVNYAVETMRTSSSGWLEVGAIQIFGDTLIESTTISKDYLLFSVYETSMGKESFKVIGVLNNFFGPSVA